MTEFKVGDRVKVNDRCIFSEIHGKVGTVVRVNDASVAVNLASRTRILYKTSVDKLEEKVAAPEDITLEEYKKKVLEVALKAKEDNGWCDAGFAAALKELDLPDHVVDTYDRGTIFRHDSKQMILFKYTETHWRVASWNIWAGESYEEFKSLGAVFERYPFFKDLEPLQQP